MTSSAPKLTPVVVTGFGPFGEHKINASWETVKALSSLNLQEYGINLIAEEVPVVYEIANSTILNLWEKHNPELMVHIGVSGIATEITLETLAHKSGYFKKDVQGLSPMSSCCRVGDEECIATELDVNKVKDEMNKSDNIGVTCCVSSNAGRYLCEYTFYTSLSINRSRAVFIHVPDINKPYSVEQMAECVKKIILSLLKQMKSPAIDGHIHTI